SPEDESNDIVPHFRSGHLLAGLRILGNKHGTEHVARGIRLGGEATASFGDRCTQGFVKIAEHLLHAEPREAWYEIGKPEDVERIETAATRETRRRRIPPG